MVQSVPGKLDISVGLVCFDSAKHASFEDLRSEAEQRIYQNKQEDKKAKKACRV